MGTGLGTGIDFGVAGVVVVVIVVVSVVVGSDSTVVARYASADVVGRVGGRTEHVDRRLGRRLGSEM